MSIAHISKLIIETMKKVDRCLYTLELEEYLKLAVQSSQSHAMNPSMELSSKTLWIDWKDDDKDYDGFMVQDSLLISQVYIYKTH